MEQSEEDGGLVADEWVVRGGLGETLTFKQRLGVRKAKPHSGDLPAVFQE